MTGASSGIGFELAGQSARSGFDLIAASNREALKKATPAPVRLGARTQIVQADLATRSRAEKLYNVIIAGKRLATAITPKCPGRRERVFLSSKQG